ncbi:MAG: MBL fold metallo-hydrolase [Nitrospirales bacterium]|nr:MBL fold metallo-hydrolase [Nitrospirales bacterium]
MEIKRIVVGPLQVNCFIIADRETGDALVIDPGDEPERILDQVKGLSVRQVVCTHGHFDHVGAVAEISEATGAQISLHAAELETYRSASDMAALWGFEVNPMPEPGILLAEGDTLQAGSISLRVIHTPGHSPGGICLLGEGIAVTGDTLFAGSVGRTDFPGGDQGRLVESFRRLMALPEETRVLPGHGPETTIGRERRDNLFSGLL